MPITRFEDLIAWHDEGRAAPKARELTRHIYEVTRGGELSRDFGLRDQMQRAAVSIMSNLAEGFERGRESEFLPFLSIAKASCAEVRSQLYVALDAGYLNRATFEALLAQAEEVGRIVAGLRLSVQRKKESP